MHEGHRQRMRQRYKKVGIDAFAEHERLELLLGYAIARKDVNPIAHALINKFGSVAEVFNASIYDLMAIDGIGESTAIMLSMIGALNKENNLKRMGVRPDMRNPKLACEYGIKLLHDKKSEFFYVFLLDNQQRLIKAELIAEGMHNQTIIDPVKVVKAAIDHRAAYAILCHNHPGGSLKPSSADIALTQQLADALQLIGTKCVEHIIVAQKNAYAIGAKREYFTDPSLSLNESSDLSDPYVIYSALRKLNEAETELVVSLMQEEHIDAD